MKVLFLDFDGVLNRRGSWGRELRPDECMIHRIELDCAAELARILASVPDIQVVISSTWRILTPIGQICSWCESAGIPLREYICRRAPSTPVTSEYRGEEIQQWLDRNPCESFVILDDSSDMVHLMPHLVRVNNQRGLTSIEADEVISRLTQ